MEKKRKWYEITYFVFLALWAISFIVMPFGYEQIAGTLMYVSGGCFWLGMVGTIGSCIIAYALDKKKIGFTCFFNNKVTIIADTMIIIAVVGFIIANELIKNLVVAFLFIAIFVSACGIHGWFNTKKTDKEM